MAVVQLFELEPAYSITCIDSAKGYWCVFRHFQTELLVVFEPIAINITYIVSVLCKYISKYLVCQRGVLQSTFMLEKIKSASNQLRIDVILFCLILGSMTKWPSTTWGPMDVAQMPHFWNDDHFLNIYLISGFETLAELNLQVSKTYKYDDVLNLQYSLL